MLRCEEQNHVRGARGEGGHAVSKRIEPDSGTSLDETPGGTVLVDCCVALFS